MQDLVPFPLSLPGSAPTPCPDGALHSLYTPTPSLPAGSPQGSCCQGPALPGRFRPGLSALLPDGSFWWPWLMVPGRAGLRLEAGWAHAPVLPPQNYRCQRRPQCWNITWPEYQPRAGASTILPYPSCHASHPLLQSTWPNCLLPGPQMLLPLIPPLPEG